MAAELILAPEAEQDLSEAYAWYEGRRTGLGEDFLSAFEACLEAVSRSPKNYPALAGSVRRALLRRFPYAVFFGDSPKLITVYALFHTSRDPEKWRSRIE